MCSYIIYHLPIYQLVQDIPLYMQRYIIGDLVWELSRYYRGQEGP